MWATALYQTMHYSQDLPYSYQYTICPWTYISYASKQMVLIAQEGKFLMSSLIMKTYLYNVDPLKPHFYMVRLGFTGIYIIFLISAQKQRLWVLIRTALRHKFNCLASICVFPAKTKVITRAVIGQRSSPAGYILYCNIFIIKKFKMYNNNKTQTQKAKSLKHEI